MGAIDFGILVDGAVVLVENVIHAMRHERPRHGAGAAPARGPLGGGRRRARRSTRCCIIIAALVPVFTLQSVEGRIFRPLALTYSFALRRRAGVLADAGAGAVRGAVPPAARSARGAALDRAAARALPRVRSCALLERRGGSSLAAGLLLVVAGGARARAHSAPSSCPSSTRATFSCSSRCRRASRWTEARTSCSKCRSGSSRFPR